MSETFPPSATQPHHAARLRALLARGGCQVAPEAQDGLLGRLVQQAGFELAFVSALGTAINRIGQPDEGLLTATELVDNAGRVIDAARLPVVVDAVSGFGNPINVRRTVRELERIGAAGVMLSDGLIPQSHRGEHEAIPAAEMVAKLQAAQDARTDAALVLIAAVECVRLADRTQEAAQRARSYHAAGADLVYLGMLSDRAGARTLALAFEGLPLACSLAPQSDLTPHELAALGFRLAFVPHCGLLAALPAIEFTFAELKQRGTIGHLRGSMADFKEFTTVAGLPEIQQLENRYGVPEDQRTTL